MTAGHIKSNDDQRKLFLLPTFCQTTITSNYMCSACYNIRTFDVSIITQAM